MNPKAIVTIYIYKGQSQTFQRIRFLPRLLQVGFSSLLCLIPLGSIPNRGMTAYAQSLQLQTQTADPWYQSLEIAHSKVQAALSPGAFGHGVPGLHNLTTNDILTICGISVLGGIVAYIAVRVILKVLNRESRGRVSLLNKMI